MWFKNLFIFRFNKAFELTSDELESQLAEHTFKPCGPNDSYQIGWSSPLGRNGQTLVHVSDKYWLICLCKQERILPSSVVAEQVAERVELIEAEQHRKVGRKEKTELKEQVSIELLPKAFTRTQRFFAYLCPKEGYLVVNSASSKVIDEVTSYLRKTIGSLPVRPIEVKQSPASVMTEWLTNDRALPNSLSMGFECDLVSNGEDKAAIKYKGLELDIEQIQQHLQTDMRVDKLSVSWNENINFTIGSDLTFRRLKFSDLVQEKLDDVETDDEASKFDASFTLMTAEVDQLIPDLLDAFGGEDRSTIVE